LLDLFITLNRHFRLVLTYIYIYHTYGAATHSYTYIFIVGIHRLLTLTSSGDPEARTSWKIIDGRIDVQMANVWLFYLLQSSTPDAHT
jgi:hypothetical protein